MRDGNGIKTIIQICLDYDLGALVSGKVSVYSWVDGECAGEVIKEGLDGDLCVTENDLVLGDEEKELPGLVLAMESHAGAC
jgi:hypothetical protein